MVGRGSCPTNDTDIFTAAILETEGEITKNTLGREVSLTNGIDIFITAI